jgi:hypothetical protein
LRIGLGRARYFRHGAHAWLFLSIRVGDPPRWSSGHGCLEFAVARCGLPWNKRRHLTLLANLSNSRSFLLHRVPLHWDKNAMGRKPIARNKKPQFFDNLNRPPEVASRRALAAAITPTVLGFQRKLLKAVPSTYAYGA